MNRLSFQPIGRALAAHPIDFCVIGSNVRSAGWTRRLKRLMDIVGSAVMIVLAAPIMLAVAVAIRLGSRGSAIFRQERVGRGGRTFRLFKFRSMYSDSCIGSQCGDREAALAHENELLANADHPDDPVRKIKNDPRVTWVGRHIRRWSLDELPQLFNVLIGDMSLVGPRPHLPREVAQYDQYHLQVLEVVPGLTGLPQVSGRSDLCFETQVALNVFYISYWSLLLDILILLKTPLAVLSRKGAY